MHCGTHSRVYKELQNKGFFVPGASDMWVILGKPDLTVQKGLSYKSGHPGQNKIRPGKGSAWAY